MSIKKKGMNHMKTSTYKNMKLVIFESAADGSITTEERDNLLVKLESKKEDTELTQEGINDFLDELADKYPDLADDIEKLGKKINKTDDSSDDSKDDSSDDSKDDDSGEVSEAALSLYDSIMNL
jgi:hypothetical protein